MNLVPLLQALEARFPLLHPAMRHSLRLSRLAGQDYLALVMSGQPEIVLDPADFRRDIPELVDAIAAECARAKAAKALIEAEGGQA